MDESTCQNATTVLDPSGSGKVGLMAADGPWQGRYLGDESTGGIVDWAQESFSGVTIPDLPEPATQVTPAAPTLEPGPACDAESTVIIPTTTGVVCEQQRIGDDIYVTASTANGYVIATGSVTDWTFRVSASGCATPEPPAGPATIEPGKPEPAGTDRPVRLVPDPPAARAPRSMPPIRNSLAPGQPSPA